MTISAFSENLGSFAILDNLAVNLYNGYKYDQNYPFGALLISFQNEEYVWVDRPQQLPQAVSRVKMTINDDEPALGDNAGALKVCFSR